MKQKNGTNLKLNYNELNAKSNRFGSHSGIDWYQLAVIEPFKIKKIVIHHFYCYNYTLI